MECCHTSLLTGRAEVPDRVLLMVAKLYIGIKIKCHKVGLIYSMECTHHAIDKHAGENTTPPISDSDSE